ncbi:dhhc zinc finger domain containing protein [Stylonychia lemnae]|uniref:Palmitoyltransferase n=1 Tax=Stylonychia lemnae TaxID=5949 RepID=A0A078B796_STYLE|nr:dhhc zinc finger domain containing protein [Stylonychia lemnae]|eukprot:CDW89177.1 dhhc zinc finger domain containing protein [Stylonychia lemnae]
MIQYESTRKKPVASNKFSMRGIKMLTEEDCVYPKSSGDKECTKGKISSKYGQVVLDYFIQQQIGHKTIVLKGIIKKNQQQQQRSTITAKNIETNNSFRNGNIPQQTGDDFALDINDITLNKKKDNFKDSFKSRSSSQKQSIKFGALKSEQRDLEVSTNHQEHKKGLRRLSPKPMPSLFSKINPKSSFIAYHEEEDYYFNDENQIVTVLNTKQMRDQTETGRIHIELRYCTVCNIEQPLRSKHCRKCNRCISTYDHHCPWLGECLSWQKISYLKVWPKKLGSPFNIGFRNNLRLYFCYHLEKDNQFVWRMPRRRPDFVPTSNNIKQSSNQQSQPSQQK